MKRGIRIAALVVVALALPILITLATYAIGATSLSPTTRLTLSVDSHQLEPTPEASSTRDADRSPRKKRRSPTPSHTIGPTSGSSGATIITTSSPSKASGDDKRGGGGSGEGGDN